MGVRNFKPSIRHQIANTCKNFNICNQPNLDNVTPKVGLYINAHKASARQINSKQLTDTGFAQSDNALIDIR